MDVRFLGITFTVVIMLPFQKDDENVEDPVRQKNPGVNHLSPNAVLSTLSGSLPLPTLIIVVMGLLIQNCEGHEVYSSDARSTADPTSSPDCAGSFYYYGFIVAVVAAVVSFLSTVYACYKWRETPKERDPANLSPDGTRETAKQKDPEDISPLTSDETQVNDMHHTEDEKQSIISALMMLKPETAKLQVELQSQLKEVDAKQRENKKKRHSVEMKIEKDPNEELLKDKRRILASIDQLDEKKKILEKVQLLIDGLMKILDKHKE